jgi:hypothetical protein
MYYHCQLLHLPAKLSKPKNEKRHAAHTNKEEFYFTQATHVTLLLSLPPSLSP